MSRGGAHNALQSLVDWKLAHAFKPLGARQVLYSAEDDAFAMLMAVVDKRRQQELVPVAELDAWNAQMKSELSSRAGRIFMNAWRSLHTGPVNWMRFGAHGREDEGWWWRWILGPLRTK